MGVSSDLKKKNAENNSQKLKSIRTTNIQFVASASRFLSYWINSIAIDHGLHPAHFPSETKKIVKIEWYQ